MKQLFTGLLLAFALSSFAQSGWGGSTPRAGYSKDTLRIRNLEKAFERVNAQLTFLQLQVDSMFSAQAGGRMGLPAEFKELVPESSDTLFGYGRDKGGIIENLPGGRLGIPELDSVRMNEFIDSLGAIDMVSGTLRPAFDSGRARDNGYRLNTGILMDTANKCELSVPLGWVRIANFKTGVTWRVDTLTDLHLRRPSYDTIEVIRFITDENKSTFWNQRTRRPFTARVFVIFDNWGNVVGYLTRQRKPIPKGFKVWTP